MGKWRVASAPLHTGPVPRAGLPRSVGAYERVPRQGDTGRRMATPSRPTVHVTGGRKRVLYASGTKAALSLPATDGRSRLASYYDYPGRRAGSDAGPSPVGLHHGVPDLLWKDPVHHG